MNDSEHTSDFVVTHVPCAGGVVIGDGGTIALVRNQKHSLWFFPKGHVEAGELDEDAARREIEEEASLKNLEYIDDLGTYMRPRIHKDGSYSEIEFKSIHMYLFAAAPHAAIKAAMEIAEARWAPYREVAALLEDNKDRVWFASVFDRVREAIQRD